MKTQNPQFEARVRYLFDCQRTMETIGATLESVNPGVVEIRLPFNNRLTQQNGYLHAGIVTTIVDSACGYAAFSLVPAEANVLTVEYKANFLAPARGEVFVATGRVLKAGRTLIICQGEVLALELGTEPVPVATMLATMMVLPPKH